MSRPGVSTLDRLLPAVGFVTAGLIAVVPALSTRGGVLLLFVGLTLLVGYSLPAKWLLALATASVIFPVDYGTTQQLARFLPVSIVPLLLWLYKRRHDIKISATLSWALLILTILGALSSITGIAPITSLRFLIVLLIIVGLPSCIDSIPESDQESVVRTLVTVAGAMGVFAAIEAALTYNPLSKWFAAGSSPLVQHWESYRVFTTIGHPLVNGTVLATGVVLSLHEYLNDRFLHKNAAALAGLFSAIGVTLTGSRSAFVAAAVGAALVSILTKTKKADVGRRIVRVVFPVGILVAYFFLDSSREASDEASGSVEARQIVFSGVERLISGHELLGTGPGTAEIRNGLISWRPDIPLESILLQVFVSSGYIGSTAIVIFLLSAAILLIKNRRLGLIAPAATVFVSALFYNMFEQQIKAVAFGGLLVLLATGTRSKLGQEVRDLDDVDRSHYANH